MILEHRPSYTFCWNQIVVYEISLPFRCLPYMNIDMEKKPFLILPRGTMGFTFRL